MALLHEATITPDKLELLAEWLPDRPWAGPAAGSVRRIGAYRFDDPDGEVGIECFVLEDGAGRVLHVPLTYRGAPLEGAELVGTTEHSVLGRRWVYDGCTDPVWAQVAVTTVLTGGRQAELVVETAGGELISRSSETTVTGSGTPGAQVPRIDVVSSRADGLLTVVSAGELEIVVVREVVAGDLPEAVAACAGVLTGQWPGGSGVLAGVRPTPA